MTYAAAELWIALIVTWRILVAAWPGRKGQPCAAGLMEPSDKLMATAVNYACPAWPCNAFMDAELEAAS